MFMWYRKISNFNIDTSDYEKSLKTNLSNLVDFSENKQLEQSSFSLNFKEIEQTLRKYNFYYFYIDSLKSAVFSKNEISLLEGLRQLTSWISKKKYISANMSIEEQDLAYKRLRTVVENLRTFADQINNARIDNKYSEQDAMKDFERLLSETKNRALVISQYIFSAIKRIEMWNGSQISLSVLPVDKDNFFEPSDSVMVEFLSSKSDSPFFTIYELKNNKVVIDDVLEAGDTDFFVDNKVQSDYFNLVKELRSPGSLSKSQLLTLFTARPKKHREIYLNSKTIPSNIFLTDKLDSAEGLAIDLGGSDGTRDVWKVKIKSKYLVQTLDGFEKQYQVVGDDQVPVESLELIYNADDIKN